MNRCLFSTTLSFFIAIALLTTACERTNDPDHELRRRLEAQAASDGPSVTVSLGYMHQFSNNSPDLKQQAPTNDDPTTPPDRILQARTKTNQEIEITAFYLVTSALELHICEQDYDPTFGHLEQLRQWFIPNAHAHVPSSATRLGVPFVENLLAAPNQARIVGSIAPPLFDYCRLYAILSPADDDILNLTELDTELFEHKTMRVTGRLRADPQQEWQSFMLESADRRVIEMKLIAPDTGKQPLSLAATNGHALILVEKTIDHTIFDDLDSASLLDGSAASIILDRVIPTFRIHEFSKEGR